MRNWKFGDRIYVGWIHEGKIYVWRDEVSSYNPDDGTIGLTHGGYGPYELKWVSEDIDDCYVSTKRRHVYEWAIEANNIFIDKLLAAKSNLDRVIETSGCDDE